MDRVKRTILKNRCHLSPIVAGPLRSLTTCICITLQEEEYFCSTSYSLKLFSSKSNTDAVVIPKQMDPRTSVTF